jgi:hypothetical protein
MYVNNNNNRRSFAAISLPDNQHYEDPTPGRSHAHRARQTLKPPFILPKSAF